jgi:serine/threonine-protein kinase
MSLRPGTRLGPYELQALVGAGGMGEVYRARDTRLDRTVAIKVLAGPAADREHLRERFDREARAVSRLNHPNICTLFDVGEASVPAQEGRLPPSTVSYLVMEYLEGETLAARLTRGPLSLAETIRAAIETADALARAHAAGIVHRDLKPANIMRTRAGVKLLDFGIAKMAAVAEAADANTRTRPDTLTEDGTTVGTIQYMAPEQLEGKPVDARTDIFAFGAVMYEMITGRKAFAGDSSAGTIAAILNATPPSPASLAPLTPRSLDRLVMTCLAKPREDRWQSSVDLLRELRWLGDQSATADTAPTQATGVAPRSRARQVALVAAGLIAGALLGAGLVRWRTAPGGPLPTPVVRFPIMLAPGDTLAADSVRAGSSLDLSPDGSKLAYVVVRNGRAQLMLRWIDRIEPTALPGTEDASTPFFSPDGEWIGFFAEEKLKKIATGGGAPLILTSVTPVTRGASWAPDGTIYLAPTFSDPLFKVPDAGGTLAPVTTLDKGEASHLQPHVLPSGRAVIFTVWNGGSFADASLWVWSAETGRRHKLLDSASAGRYASTGHLVFVRGKALLAVPFDLVRLEVPGSSVPVPVADDVEINVTNGTAQFALSAAGSLVYAARATSGGSDLVWVDRHGTEERVPDVHGDFEEARLSPDGRRVAVQTLNDIWMCDLATSALRRLTFAGVNQCPVWTMPDGARVAFSVPAVGTPPSLFWAPADGSGQAEQMTTDREVSFPSDWSPDGSVLAFSHTSGVQGGNWDIMAWHRSGGTISAIEHSDFNEFLAAFSPDGRWLAYASDLSGQGRPEVYVRPYPGEGARVPISTDGGSEPQWGPDSHEVFYVRGDSLMRVAVKTTPEFVASKPEELFHGRYRRIPGSPGYTSYSVSPDGRRFLMIKPADSGSGPTSLTVVLGALEDWNRRARHAAR